MIKMSLATLAIVTMLALSALAEISSFSAISRPIPVDGGATKVYVAMGLMDIDEIDSAEQNFTVNLYIGARWSDPRLTHAGPGEVVIPLTGAWHPELLFVNQQKLFPSLPEVLRVSPDGSVAYSQRIWGPFSQSLDLHNFPFDTQTFEMRVATARATTAEIAFEADNDAPSGLAPSFSLPDWEVTQWSLDISPYQPMGSSRGNASFALVIDARRYASHHMIKIILPLILIVAMSWIAFWIDPSQSGTQIGVATTSMLTLIAYRFMVGGQVPPVPYLTRMDFFILGSTVIVFAGLVQVVITSAMASYGRQRQARTLDRICRALFPVAFALLSFLALRA